MTQTGDENVRWRQMTRGMSTEQQQSQCQRTHTPAGRKTAGRTADSGRRADANIRQNGSGRALRKKTLSSEPRKGSQSCRRPDAERSAQAGSKKEPLHCDHRTAPCQIELERRHQRTGSNLQSPDFDRIVVRRFALADVSAMRDW